MRSTMRRAIAVLVVSIVGMTLAGCVGIPRSGAVNQGDELAAPGDIDVIFQPDGPSEGASQQDILSGFIRAALNPSRNFEVARSFLSTGFVEQWKPEAGVTIDQSGRQPAVASDNAIDLRVTPVARVGTNGEYTAEQTPAPVSRSYTFVRERGQWRINTAPDGVLMLASEFTEVFKSYSLYFYDPGYTRLVPDLRWFPRVASNTGSNIVRSLISGPSSWLTGAALTAFPEGTTVGSVLLDGNLARVDLSGPVLDTSATAVQRMQSQLEASLIGDVNGVSNVQMTVDRNEVPVATSDGAPLETGARVNSQALVMRNGQFGFLSGNSLLAIDGLSDEVAKTGATSVAYAAAVAGQRDLAAVGTPSGVYTLVPDAAPVLVDDRAGLIEPSIDPGGFVWTVPRASPQQVRVSVAGRTPATLTATWDGATEIASLKVSRDGARVLALVSAGDQPRLVVAAILRDKDGVPTSIGEPIDLAEGAGTPIDATWVDALTVASVTLRSGGDNVIIQQQIGGTSTALANATGVRLLAGSNDTLGLRLLTAGGTIQQQSASTWQDRASGISLLATQY